MYFRHKEKEDKPKQENKEARKYKPNMKNKQSITNTSSWVFKRGKKK